MKTIYINGNFYTFEEAKPRVEAVVIEDGRFIDMGTTEQMLHSWARVDYDIINLHGQTVTPGLIDSHNHMSAVAGNFIDLDVTGLTSKQAMLQAIKQQAGTLEAGEWQIGRASCREREERGVGGAC